MSIKVSDLLAAKYPTGTPVEWSDADGSYLGLQLPDGSKVVDTVYTPGAAPLAQVAAAAEQADRDATKGFALAHCYKKVANSQPVRASKSLKATTGAAATHTITATVDGVLVEIPCVVKDQ